MYRNSCAWGVGLTKTFRNRSHQLINGAGANCQNPSDGMCRIHIPDDGCLFSQPDLAGAEALVVAMLTPPDSNFRLLFKHGIKPHVFVALHLFVEHWAKETPYDSKFLCTLKIPELAQHPEFKLLNKIIKNHHERYFIGKKSCHSFNYLKRANTYRFDVLKESEGKIVLSLKDSERFREIYVGLFPEIFGFWHDRVITTLRQDRIIYNCLGYPHYFGGHVENDKAIREAIATGPQSTVGCVANIAACDFQDYVEDNYPRTKRWDLLNNKHDSLLIQAPDAEIMEASRVLCKMMSNVELLSPFGEKFYMKTECSIGKNWMKWDEEKNPDGLKETDIWQLAA